MPSWIVERSLKIPRSNINHQKNNFWKDKSMNLKPTKTNKCASWKSRKGNWRIYSNQSDKSKKKLWIIREIKWINLKRKSRSKNRNISNLLKNISIPEKLWKINISRPKLNMKSWNRQSPLWNKKLTNKWECMKKKIKPSKLSLLGRAKTSNKIVFLFFYLDKARMRAKERNLQALRDNYEKMQEVCIDKIKQLEETLTMAKHKLNETEQKR